MSVSGPIFLLIWGISDCARPDLVLASSAFCEKSEHPADHQPTSGFSAMMIDTGMLGSFTTIPTILRCLSKNASASDGP